MDEARLIFSDSPTAVVDTKQSTQSIFWTQVKAMKAEFLKDTMCQYIWIWILYPPHELVYAMLDSVSISTS